MPLPQGYFSPLEFQILPWWKSRFQKYQYIYLFVLLYKYMQNSFRMITLVALLTTNLLSKFKIFCSFFFLSSRCFQCSKITLFSKIIWINYFFSGLMLAVWYIVQLMCLYLILGFESFILSNFIFECWRYFLELIM